MGRKIQKSLRLLSSNTSKRRDTPCLYCFYLAFLTGLTFSIGFVEVKFPFKLDVISSPVLAQDATESQSQTLQNKDTISQECSNGARQLDSAINEVTAVIKSSNQNNQPVNLKPYVARLERTRGDLQGSSCNTAIQILDVSISVVQDTNGDPQTKSDDLKEQRTKLKEFLAASKSPPYTRGDSADVPVSAGSNELEEKILFVQDLAIINVLLLLLSVSSKLAKLLLWILKRILSLFEGVPLLNKLKKPLENIVKPLSTSIIASQIPTQVGGSSDPPKSDDSASSQDSEEPISQLEKGDMNEGNPNFTIGRDKKNFQKPFNNLWVGEIQRSNLQSNTHSLEQLTQEKEVLLQQNEALLQQNEALQNNQQVMLDQFQQQQSIIVDLQKQLQLHSEKIKQIEQIVLDLQGSSQKGFHEKASPILTDYSSVIETDKNFGSGRKDELEVHQKRLDEVGESIKIVAPDESYKLVLDLYNCNPIALEAEAIKVAESRESFSRRYQDSSQPAILENKDKGNWWIVQRGSVYWLLPKPGLKVNTHIYEDTFSLLFVSEGYEEGRNNLIQLIFPAVVEPSGGQWLLKQPGKVTFKNNG